MVCCIYVNHIFEARNIAWCRVLCKIAEGGRLSMGCVVFVPSSAADVSFLLNENSHSGSGGNIKMIVLWGKELRVVVCRCPKRLLFRSSHSEGRELAW